METNAADLKKTPLNAWHRAHGAKMMEFGGWDMPVQYETGILQEHLATRKFGGLFDVSHMGRFRIRGKDQVRFLQHVLSNNAEALNPWQAQYTLVPNESGGLIDDAYLYRFEADDYLLVVNASNAGKDWAHFTRHAGAFAGLAIENQTETLSMIAFQGPLSASVLGGLITEGSLPKPFRNSLSVARARGVPVMIGRTGYTGEPVGFELFVPAERSEAVWSALYEAGRGRGVVAVGLGARDTLRLEAALPLYGHEFGTDPEGKEIPAFSFPLTRVAVSFSSRKGEFEGRAALWQQCDEARKLRDGRCARSDVLPRLTMPVALLDKGVARQGYEVLAGERRVGFVTSGTVTPYWRFEGEGATMRITDQGEQRPIALAYLDAGICPGQVVDVMMRGRRLKAEVVRWHGRSEAPPYFRPIPAQWEAPAREKAAGEGIRKAQRLLQRSVENHEWRQRQCVNLIPSEMTPSPLVRMLQVSDPVGRYAEHKELLAAFGQEVYYYQGTDFIAWVEERIVEEMKAFLGCPLAEARAISGQMANATVFSALVDFRNRHDRRREPERIRLAMNNHIGNGGHLSAQPMGALRDYIAKDPVTEQFAVINFPVRHDNPYRIDLDATAKILEAHHPELIILGKSMVLHPEPVAQMAALANELKERPVIMYDMAHVLGLVGPHFQLPFDEGADIVTGSTHKTFFGTQRGIIGAAFSENTPRFDLWKAIQRRAFPGMVSNHHLGSLLGLLMAAIEMNTFKAEYQPQVIANAKAFAVALKDAGLEVEGDPAVDYTETHQVMVRVGYGKGCEMARSLEANNIIVNYQALPGDESFTSSSGLRLGVSEMTRFGMKEADFREFAGLFADVVKAGRAVRHDVAKFRQRFLDIGYCFDGKDVAGDKKSLLGTF